MQNLDKTRIAVLLAVGLAGAAVSCSKEHPPAAERPKSPTGQQGGDNDQVAKARFDEANFSLEVVPRGEYQVGKAGELAVVLEAKAPFKCNDKYPYKLKLDKSEGVTIPKAVVTKDSVILEKQKAVMTVAFTPTAAGSQRVSGEFSFSVCTDDKCLIEKRKLALKISVR